MGDSKFKYQWGGLNLFTRLTKKRSLVGVQLNLWLQKKVYSRFPLKLYTSGSRMKLDNLSKE